MICIQYLKYRDRGLDVSETGQMGAVLIWGIGSAVPTLTKFRGDGWGAKRERIKLFFFL
jgi:hypothetical protein